MSDTSLWQCANFCLQMTPLWSHWKRCRTFATNLELAGWNAQISCFLPSFEGYFI